MNIVLERCLREIQEYSNGRKSDIDRGAETPRLSALMLEKFVYGMAKGFKQFEDAETIAIANELIALGDKLCLEIDPDFIQNRKARWNARPADIAL